MSAAYRWLTTLLVVDVALQIALAALGVFRAGGGGDAAREQSVFDPHRANGYVVMLIALLLLAAAIVAKNGRWRIVLPLFVLTLVQSVLAHAGAVGGFFHGLVAFALVGGAIELARGAWTGRPSPAQ